MTKIVTTRLFMELATLCPFKTNDIKMKNIFSLKMKVQESVALT